MDNQDASSQARDFVFDIVINQLMFKDTGADTSLVSVTVTFRDVEYEITSSHLNVSSFREGRSFEFQENLKNLRDSLEASPLKLTINRESDVVGDAVIEWPPKLLNDLENDYFSTFSHSEECAILDNSSEKIGSLIVMIKFQVKCKADLNSHGVSVCADKAGNLPISEELDRVIDPNDVLFVIGDMTTENYGQNVLTQCGNETCPLTLDLAKYKIVRGKLVKSPEILNTCGNLDCCEMKSGAEDYSALVSELCKKFDHMKHKKKSSVCSQRCVSPCKPPRNKSGFACQADRHVNECPHSDKFSDLSTSEDMDDESLEEVKKKFGPCPYPSSPPELKCDKVVRPTICPICKKDISWLPKFAACPKCGYKPVPYHAEQDYNDKLTADDIISEWTDCQRNSKSVPKDQDESCRCKCRNGKTCAYCRIKKICSDLYRGRRACEPKGCVRRKPINPYEECKEENADHRPYLSRVLSELKDLYGIHPKNFKSNTKKMSKMEEKCEKMINEVKRRKKAKSLKVAPAPTLSASVDLKGIVKQSRESRKCKEICENKPELSAKDPLTCKTRRRPKKLIPPQHPTRPPTITHKDCVGEGHLVPHHMGWMWNLSACHRPGWKPGAIGKNIKEIMRYFLKDFPVDTINCSKYAYKKKPEEKTDCEDVEQKPTLHVQKKSGDYLITLRPLKDGESLKECQDPYLTTKPIQFRITKNPMVVHKREVKSKLKQMGFKKCCCHVPVACCYCRPYLEKQRLEFELKKICSCRKIPNLRDSLVLSDTTDSDSELDIEFTPPAGLKKPALKKKPDMVCRETQYSEEDWNFRPVFMKAPNKYQTPFDCARRFGLVDEFDRQFVPNNGVRGGGPPPIGAMTGMRSRIGPGRRLGGPGGRGSAGGGAGARPMGGAGAGPGGRQHGRAGGRFGKGKGKPDLTKGIRKKVKLQATIPPPLLCRLDRRRKPLPSCPCGPCDPCGYAMPCAQMCHNDCYYNCPVNC